MREQRICPVAVALPLQNRLLPRRRPLLPSMARAMLISLRIIGQIESNYDETVDSFDEMNLKAELLRGKKGGTKRRHQPTRLRALERHGKLDRLGCEAYQYTHSSRYLRLWFRASVCYSAACHHPCHQG